MEDRKGVSVQPAQPVEPGEPGVPGASMAGYWWCREEQQPRCEDMQSHVAIGALPEEGRTWRFSALGAALLLMWLMCRPCCSSCTTCPHHVRPAAVVLLLPAAARAAAP